ncbi:MAG: LysE family transporter, partial [Kangiellaceae bacterium]|nr:LysE family transporter [Kangiellaceae bacterium]
TFLNPHVYLDTVVLLGSIGSQFPEHLRVYFSIGTMSAGIVWFFSLSMAGKMLSPILSKPRPWRILNGLIGITLVYVAATILRL